MPVIGSIRGARGCTLIEVLVASAIFTVAVVALAQLTAIAARARLLAGRTSVATVIAQQKIEELLARDLAVNPSPAGALDTCVDGWFDFVDRHGRSIGSAAGPPSGSDYLRRWSVEPVVGGETSLVQVVVLDIRQATRVETDGTAVRRADHVRLVAAKGRRAF